MADQIIHKILVCTMLLQMYENANLTIYLQAIYNYEKLGGELTDS
jgi:hypothetical protein